MSKLLFLVIDILAVAIATYLIVTSDIPDFSASLLIIWIAAMVASLSIRTMND